MTEVRAVGEERASASAGNVLNVPVGYMRTEAGVIPEDWELEAISAIASVKTGPFGSALHERDYVDNGTPIITVEHLSEYGIKYQNLPLVSDADRLRLKTYLLRAGDIVFSRVGSVDRNSLVTPDEDGWLFSGRLLRVRVSSKHNTSPRYLSYHLHTESFKKRVHSVAVGQTMASLNTEILRAVKVPLPPLSEQRAIAAVLSDVDELIGSLEALIAKKQAIKQAAMQELLTGRTRLPGCGGEWVAVALADVADIRNGGTPRTGIPAYWGGRIPWCVPTDITASRGKYLVTTTRSITPEGLASCGATLLPAGSLLLCSRATIGEIRIASMPVATNQGFKSMVCAESADSEFLYYRLVTLKERMIDLATGSTFLEISKRDVASIHIPLPPLPEQQAIATILSDMDAEIAALERRLDKTRAIKQGMMQQLLTGSIRLPIPDVDTEDDHAHDA